VISGAYTRGDSLTISKSAMKGRITTNIKLAAETGLDIELSDPFPLTGYIGPTVGHQLRDKAVIAIFFSLVAIIIYIRLRFKEYKYGFAAATALVHDVLITLGAVALARMSGLVDVEIDLPLIAAFMTIIGYSLNDTIVVFDRVRENLPRINLPFNNLVNLSINQTLSRTVLTSITTLLTVIILFVLNYNQRNVMEGFSFALIVGLVVGTYSSIFVASPVLLLLHRREQQTAAGK
jgi:preprotein translocase SecF subunit